MVRIAGVMIVAVLGGLPSWAEAGQGPVRVASRATTGMIDVDSTTPGLSVRVDGELRGKTPLRIGGLAAGVHVVEVGAGWKQTISVAQGAHLQISVPIAGSPSDGPTLVEGPSVSESLKNFATDNPIVVTIFRQPWVYASAAAFGVSLLAAGVLWTSTPSRIPFVGALPFEVTSTQWKMAQWGILGVTGMLALSTVVLFLLPGLPFLPQTRAPDAS